MGYTDAGQMQERLLIPPTRLKYENIVSSQ